MTPPPQMTVEQLKAMMDAGQLQRGEAIVLDVREPHELAISALPGPGVVHMPMQTVPARLAELPRDRPIAVLCRVGGRSAQVTAYLRRQGFDATNIAGGINAWAARIDPSLKPY